MICVFLIYHEHLPPLNPLLRSLSNVSVLLLLYLRFCMFSLIIILKYKNVHLNYVVQKMAMHIMVYKIISQFPFNLKIKPFFAPLTHSDSVRIIIVQRLLGIRHIYCKSCMYGGQKLFGDGKNLRNNLQNGGILASTGSFPAFRWFGCKSGDLEQSGDSVAPCHLLH